MIGEDREVLSLILLKEEGECRNFFSSKGLANYGRNDYDNNVLALGRLEC